MSFKPSRLHWNERANDMAGSALLEAFDASAGRRRGVGSWSLMAAIRERDMKRPQTSQVVRRDWV